MSCLLEVVFLGNEEQKFFDYKLRFEVVVYVDLVLGCFKEFVRSFWISMQDYVVSKGKIKRRKWGNIQLICLNNLCVCIDKK